MNKTNYFPSVNTWAARRATAWSILGGKPQENPSPWSAYSGEEKDPIPSSVT